MKSKPKKMMGEMRANDKAKDFETKLQRVRNTKTIKENIEKVLEFDKECEQNGHKLSSRYSVLVTLHCLCQFTGSKPFKQFTKADIINFLDASRNRKFEDTRYRARANPKNVEKQLAHSTMNLIKLRVKRFFQWLYGMEKDQYPESVRWIKIETIKSDRELTPQDLPKVEEVKRMIECTENPRDRALLALLPESGIRCGEASTLLLKDISWTERGFTLTIRGNNSKSGFGRQIPLCACAQDVKNYINSFHPFRTDKDSPLFVSFADRRTPKSNLKVAGIGGIVTKVAERAGVNKRIRVHPHLFRHFRASQLAELGWNEAMLRQFFGWSKTSSMPATYIHMSQKSLNDKYYQMYGKAGPKKEKPQMLEEPKACSKCGVQNPTGYRFCFQCNAALDQEQHKRMQVEKEVRDTLNFIAEDPKLAKQFSKLLQEAIKKQKYEHLTQVACSTQN
jgi:integrase